MRLSSWLKANKLIVNTSKTKLMLFTPRLFDNLSNVYFNNDKLEWVDSLRYLGLIIDCKLKFNIHINELSKKVSRVSGAMYSISSLLPQNVLKNLYYSLVQSVLCQDIIIWGAAPVTTLQPLFIKINNILRIILNVKKINNIPNMSVSPMYKQLKILKVFDLYKFHILKFLHYVLYSNRVLFDNYFSHLLINRDNARRQRMRLPNARLDILRHSTVFQTCILFNDLPSYLIEYMTKYLIKKRFYDFILDKY